MLLRCTVFLFLLLGLGGAARAQSFSPRSAVPPDSLRTEAALRREQPDSLRRDFDEQRLRLKLQAYTRRKTIVGRAAAAALRLTRPKEENAGLDAVLLDRQFDRHTFKVVRRVTVRPNDAFGYSLTDSTRRPRSLLDRTGNWVHIRTAPSRIRQVLLFRPGQRLAPQALAESERLLRQTDEILDARVLVNERTSTADSIDIEVITTDVFSITGNFEPGGAAAGRIDLGDQNFLGLGHHFSNTYQYGRNLDQRWRYNGDYSVPFRHFFLAQARYNNEFRDEHGGASLQRDFYSVNTRYAGALSMDSYNQQITLTVQQPGEILNYYNLRYNRQDLWVGRSLRLRSYDLGYENPGRLIVATRFTRTDYTVSPSPDYRNTNLILGTVGYSVRRYYKDRYLFGFGRTEDVPTGTLLSFTAGLDANAVVPRRYFDVRLATAIFSQRHGYLFGNVEFGTFQRLADHRAWEQGLLNAQTTYFTRLYRLGNYQYRHFLGTTTTVGFNRRPGELLQGISDERGIRGFSPSVPILATSRFAFNYETTVFTPLSLLGFRVAGVAFADAAWIGEKVGGGTPFGNTPYTGFGLGLRLRNEFTALRTFQILLGYYPRGLVSANGLRVFETARETVSFTDFGIGAPGVTIYQ